MYRLGLEDFYFHNTDNNSWNILKKNLILQKEKKKHVCNNMRDDNLISLVDYNFNTI